MSETFISGSRIVKSPHVSVLQVEENLSQAEVISELKEMLLNKDGILPFAKSTMQGDVNQNKIARTEKLLAKL